MTTRACDFSSFKRPSRPIHSSSNRYSPSYLGKLDMGNQADNTNQTKESGFSTAPRPSTGILPYQRKYMTTQSETPKMFPSPDQFRVSSTSTSSLTPVPTTAVSNQNINPFTSIDKLPLYTEHSTIDRSTLPYDQHQISASAIDRDSPSQKEERGSGLVFVDRGKRGVMSADSEYSLNGPLSGHRIDRSLLHHQNSAGYPLGGVYDGAYEADQNQQYACEVLRSPNNDVSNSFHAGQHTPQYYQGASTYMNNTDESYHANHPGFVTYPLPYNNIGDSNNIAVYYKNVVGTPYESAARTPGSPLDESSGESGIAGCEFNTPRARLYDTYNGGSNSEPFGNYGTAAAHSTGPCEDPRGPPMSASFRLPKYTFRDNSSHTGMPCYATGSESSNGGSNKGSNFAERNLPDRGDDNQQTHLLTGESDIHHNTNDQNTSTIFEANRNFPFLQSDQQHQSSVPKISTRSSPVGSYESYNPFKRDKNKRLKGTDDIYSSNNLYGKPSKHNSKVILGGSGTVTTGINFNTKYSSFKRPFCPKWQCVLLAIVIGVTIILSIALVAYLYVWPSVIEPLIESSKPVDGEWGSWRPWFECSVTCGEGIQNKTRECNSPSPEDGGKMCEGPKYEMQKCAAPIECPDCSRVCDVGTLSSDCRSCTCEGHVITGKITDEHGDPLSGVKVYKDSGAPLLLSGTNDKGTFRFEGVCSNGDNQLRLEKEMYRISRVHPTQSTTETKLGHVSFAMIKLYLPSFTVSPLSQERIVGQKVVLCCDAESEQPPTEYVWYKDNSRLDPVVYHYSLQKPSLILPDLMVWDGGDYMCAVQNEAGTVKSDPARLTIYGNWTDLCEPTPADKFISLPEGCSEERFNTGTCGIHNDSIFSSTSSTSQSIPANAYSHCLSNKQYSNDSPNDICYANTNREQSRSEYCCKPIEEKEIIVSCTLKETPYNMALKRVISCGCVMC